MNKQFVNNEITEYVNTMSRQLKCPNRHQYSSIDIKVKNIQTNIMLDNVTKYSSKKKKQEIY